MIPLVESLRKVMEFHTIYCKVNAWCNSKSTIILVFYTSSILKLLLCDSASNYSHQHLMKCSGKYLEEKHLCNRYLLFMKLISSFVEINCRICDCQLFYVDCIACLLGFSVFEKQEINNRKTTDINFE